MIRTLQKRFIKAAMIAVTALIAAMLIGINIYNLVSVNRQVHDRLDLLSRYGGERGNIPGEKEGGSGRDMEFQTPELSEKSSMEFDDSFKDGHGKGRSDEDIFMSSIFFTVRFGDDGSIISVNTSQVSQISQEDAETAAGQVYASGKDRGRLGNYIYQIEDDPFTGGRTAVFLDDSEERSSMLRIGIVSLVVGVISWLIMLAFVIMLSKKAIRPIAENIEKQKQFVTNAGHDLKTPLAIIQANCEAMELFNGENKWSTNIKSQVTRMNELTRNLLTLARMDESASNMLMEDLDMTSLVNDSIRTFAGPFKLKDVNLESEVGEDIRFKGDKAQISQLLSLLFDNSVKYVNEGGKACVTLSRTDRKVRFTISNTCDELPSAPPERLFDRFYRSDESRSQKSGGHGIGLSVAASIVQNHGGTIKAEYTGTDTIIFTVTL